MNSEKQSPQRSSILAINVANRSASSVKVQELLTQYGCFIKTRVGFHHTADDHCVEDGLIILQMSGGHLPADELMAKLNSLAQVQSKVIKFD